MEHSYTSVRSSDLDADTSGSASGAVDSGRATGGGADTESQPDHRAGLSGHALDRSERIGRAGPDAVSQQRGDLLRSADHDQPSAITPSIEDERIIEHLTTSILVVNSMHDIVMANSAAENLLRAGRTAIARMPLAHWFLDAEKIEEGIANCADTNSVYANVIRLREEGRNAQYIDIRISAYSGEPGHFLIEFTDVTSRRRITRDHTLMSQHDAGRMMARQLAHEIKNPLGGLRGAAQLMARQSDSAALKAYTDVIIAEADRMATLVDSLLGPGEEPRKDPINIHEILEHVVSLVAAEQVDKIEWHRDYDPSLPDLKLDRDQMVQAVLNLLSNATAAATSDKPAGRIELRTRAVTNETIGDMRHRVIAIVQIEDNGPGIDPDIEESIFYPLVTGRPGGTGIGLPLSQELINRHGGLIEFRSEPGRTVFEIRLPIDNDEAAP